MAAESSQGTKVLMWNGVTPVTHVVSGVTKAAPAVVSVVSATGLAVGDIVVPKDTGFRSIDDQPWKVSVVSTLAITLEGSDTTDEVNTATSGSLDEYTMAEICMAGFSVSRPAGTTLDVTTMCDTSRKTLTGMPGQASWKANGFWDGVDAVQKLAEAAYASGDPQVFQMKFRDGTGVAFAGALNIFDIDAAVDKPVTIAIGGTVTGAVNRVSP